MKLQHLRPGAWGWAAIVAWVTGVGVTFAWALIRHGADASIAELRDLLTYFVVAGLLLNGVGLALRASAHPTGSDAADRVAALKRVDGTGKVASVLGWACGLLGAVAFAMERTQETGPLIPAFVITAFVVPAVGGVLWAVAQLFGSRNKESDQ